jgi:hypothetical protein
MKLLALKTTLKFVALINVLVIFYTGHKKWKEHVSYSFVQIRANWLNVDHFAYFCCMVQLVTYEFQPRNKYRNTATRIQIFRKKWYFSWTKSPKNVNAACPFLGKLSIFYSESYSDPQCRGRFWKSYSFITVLLLLLLSQALQPRASYGLHVHEVSW